MQWSLLSNSRTFSSWKKETPYPLALTPHPLAISFVSTHWPSMGISYKWNHTCGLCFWLLSLSKMFSRFSHWIACINVSFLLMIEFYSIVCIYHIYSSIHSLEMDMWIVSSSTFDHLNRHTYQKHLLCLKGKFKSKAYMHQIITLYALYNVICQLCLYKAGGKRHIRQKDKLPFYTLIYCKHI